MHMDLTYRSKQRRDERYRQLLAMGETRLVKRSSSGDILSPDYVEDAFEDGRTKDSYSPNMFGGLSPQYWGKLYHIEAR